MVSGVRRMNEVNARRARLVPGWMTVFGRVYSGVLGGIRGYTAYTNLRGFLTAYTHLSDHK